MDLFDILESEQPASEPEAFDVAQWMAGRKAITNSGKIATFVGTRNCAHSGAIWLEAEMPVDPLRQGKGYPTAIFLLDLNGAWEGHTTSPVSLRALI